jgi:hypothetical protein
MRHSTPVETANIDQIAGINNLVEAVERLTSSIAPKCRSELAKPGRKRAG